MSTTDAAALQAEWTVLQNNIEQYEKSGLLIKLFAVALFAGSLVIAANEILTAVLIAVLWVQEGLLRTFQSRLAARIVKVEQMLRENLGPAFQLHSEWLAARAGVVGMLAEYANAAMRPTVAFPYVVLLLMVMVSHVVGAAGMAI